MATCPPIGSLYNGATWPHKHRAWARRLSELSAPASTAFLFHRRSSGLERRFPHAEQAHARQQNASIHRKPGLCQSVPNGRARPLLMLTPMRNLQISVDVWRVALLAAIGSPLMACGGSAALEDGEGGSAGNTSLGNGG